MGQKGDRASMEPLAIRLYADGMSLAAISKQLDISDTSLRRWKDSSLVPGEDADAWDKARQQKRGNIQRLKDLFERQLEYVEELEPEDVTAPMMDTLTKLGALVERWDKVEKALALIGKIKDEYMRGEEDGRISPDRDRDRKILIDEVDRVLGVR